MGIGKASLFGAPRDSNVSSVKNQNQNKIFDFKDSFFPNFVFIHRAKYIFGFWFLTEETLLSRRAPNKEALPNPTDQRLPVLILTPQTCQLTHQCMAIIERD